MNFKQISIILSFLSFDLTVNYNPIKEKNSELVDTPINNVEIIPNVYNNEVSDSEITNSLIDDSDEDFVKTIKVFSEEEIIGIPDNFSEEENIGIPDISSEENNLYFTNEPSKVLNKMDISIDSNDDIYQFSFSNIENESEIIGFKSYIDAFEIGVLNNNEILTDIHKDEHKMDNNLNKNSQEYDKKISNKLSSFYNTSMDSNKISEKDNKPLINLLDQLKIYENKTNYSNLDGLTNLIIDIHNYDSDAFFNIGIIDDLENSNINTIYLIQSGLGLPNKEFYENLEYISLYKEIVKNTFSNIFSNSRTDKDIDSLADSAVEFEKKLANINVSIEDLQVINKIKIKNLSEIYPNINWKLYFEKRIEAYNQENEINDDTLIINATPQYFEKLNNLLSETDIDSLSAYAELCIIRTYVEYVADNIELPIKTLKQLMNGLTKDSPRSEMCAEIINKRMDMVTDKFYSNPDPILLNKMYNELEINFNDFLTTTNNNNYMNQKLTHAFDSSYNDYNWLTNSTIKDFNKLSQYQSNFYDTWKFLLSKEFNQNNKDNMINSNIFENIPKQLFYISYGQLWYNKNKSETIIQQLLNNDNNL